MWCYPEWEQRESNLKRQKAGGMRFCSHKPPPPRTHAIQQVAPAQRRELTHSTHTLGSSLEPQTFTNYRGSSPKSKSISRSRENFEEPEGRLRFTIGSCCLNFPHLTHQDLSAEFTSRLHMIQCYRSKMPWQRQYNRVLIKNPRQTKEPAGRGLMGTDTPKRQCQVVKLAIVLCSSSYKERSITLTLNLAGLVTCVD